MSRALFIIVIVSVVVAESLAAVCNRYVPLIC
jgi:hypothetical protein